MTEGKTDAEGRFTETTLNEIDTARAKVEKQYQALLVGYTTHPFSSHRAKEFATHALVRRLKLLRRCIDNVFRLVPPNSAGRPSDHQLQDATINIHAFYSNLFGAFDNLAWVWVLEKDVKDKDGGELTRKDVGLGRDKKLVRESFSKEFLELLERFDEWHADMVVWRDALVHRVPIYIPPSVWNKDDAAKAEELGAQQTEAIKQFDFAKYDRLFEEQALLGRFIPWMQHSFGEGAKPIWFHPQMLSDFQVLAQLAERLLEDIVK